MSTSLQVVKPQSMTSERASLCQAISQPTFLVVGYGDQLHGDAGVGLEVARAVAQWALPDVQAVAMHQPASELLEAIAQAEYVLFVEACHGKSLTRPQVTPIDCELPRIHHGLNPSALLKMVQTRYGYQPQAWLLEVPAQEFALGAPLSAVAEQGLAQTLDRIAIFLRCYTPLRIAG